MVEVAMNQAPIMWCQNCRIIFSFYVSKHIIYISVFLDFFVDHQVYGLINELKCFSYIFNQVQCVAETPTELLEWSGWVSSRLRRLVNKLSEIAEVRLWPHEFPQPDRTDEGLCQSWFWIGVKRPHFMPPKNGKDKSTINMSHPITEFRRLVIDGYKAHIKSGMMVKVQYVKQHELPEEYGVLAVNPARASDSAPSPSSLQGRPSLDASEGPSSSTTVAPISQGLAP